MTTQNRQKSTAKNVTGKRTYVDLIDVICGIVSAIMVQLASVLFDISDVVLNCTSYICTNRWSKAKGPK